MIQPDIVGENGGKPRMLDWHNHFDPINQYGKNFRRMKAMEIFTETKQIVLSHG